MTTFGEIIDVDSTITSAYKDSDESLTKDELLSIAFDRGQIESIDDACDMLVDNDIVVALDNSGEVVISKRNDSYGEIILIGEVVNARRGKSVTKNQGKVYSLLDRVEAERIFNRFRSDEDKTEFDISDGLRGFFDKCNAVSDAEWADEQRRLMNRIKRNKYYA